MQRSYRVFWVSTHMPPPELHRCASESGLILDRVSITAVHARLRDGEASNGVWIDGTSAADVAPLVRDLRNTRVQGLAPYSGAIVVRLPTLDDDIARELDRAGADESFESELAPGDAVTLVVAAIRRARLRAARAASGQDAQSDHGALKERHEALKQALRELAHELRTPLTSAREFLEILLEGEAGPLGTRQREFVEISRRSCSQMNERIENLMEVARFETHKIEGHFALRQLDQVVQPLLQALAPQAARQGVALMWQGERLPAFLFDAERIAQALENLVGNALKFSPPQSTVELSARVCPADPHSVEVCVSDHGRGVTPEEAVGLFEPGAQRQREDATERGGLGLGLAIAREIARLHGGDLRVEPTPGGGATFVLRLARHPERSRKLALSH